MEEKHPIDKLFRDGFNKADIPFDEGAWAALSRKMRPRRRWPLLIGIGSGIAAAAAVAAILLFRPHGPLVDLPKHDTAAQQPAAPTQPIAVAPPVDPTEAITPPFEQSTKVVPTERSIEAESDRRLPASRPAVAYVQPQRVAVSPPDIGDRSYSLPVPQVAQQSPLNPKPIEQQEDFLNGPLHHGWTLGIIAAPDLSGTRPFGGKLSGNLGLMATYHFQGRLSISAGVLYAKKAYVADFADYRPLGSPDYSQYTPILVDADCGVLDIPLNMNIDIARQRQATWFASTGVSSYLMLKEVYDYTYPPHQYGNPKQLTLHNKNRHILGVANLSVGYRRQLSSGVSVTVQPFVKVPLTGIGNGRLKLYSSGVAFSADVDLTRPKKR